MMSSSFNRCTKNARRAGSSTILSGCYALGSALFACALAGSFSLAVHAQQSRTAKDGVYADGQAKRGQAIYKDRCASCHGETLGGALAPPLAGDEFIGDWGNQPLSDLVDKIKNTMPGDDPGKLTRPQVADIVAYILQAGKFPVGTAELSADEAVLKQIVLPGSQAPSSRPQGTVAGAQTPSFPPAGNLAQVMRGILFPSANVIFDAQVVDPGAPKKPASSSASDSLSVRFSDVYTGWALVDYAAVALAESAPLMLTPGRRCENGKPVPVERADWVKFTQELADAGKAAYKASQSRNQDAVIEVSNQVAESCLNCHRAYRDGRGGNAARCVPRE